MYVHNETLQSKQERRQRFNRMISQIRSYKRTSDQQKLISKVKEETKQDIQLKFNNNPRNFTYHFPLDHYESDEDGYDMPPKVEVCNLYNQNPELFQGYSKEFGVKQFTSRPKIFSLDLRGKSDSTKAIKVKTQVSESQERLKMKQFSQKQIKKSKLLPLNIGDRTKLPTIGGVSKLQICLKGSNKHIPTKQRMKTEKELINSSRYYFKQQEGVESSLQLQRPF